MSTLVEVKQVVSQEMLTGVVYSNDWEAVGET